MRHTVSLFTLVLGTTMVLSAACGDEPTTTRSVTPVRSRPVPVTLSKAGDASALQDLARLRAATARFHRFEVANDPNQGNYTFLFMNMCMTGATGANVGGMGYHYVNTTLLDGHVDVETPEALLYEPEKNGKLRLVAVEYVIPKAAWTSDEPPVLFGQSFKLNKFDLWALHVWVWEDNPDGLFADWNPRVSCQYAASQATH